MKRSVVEPPEIGFAQTLNLPWLTITAMLSKLLACCLLAVLCALGVSAILTWGASLPRVSDTSLPVAFESANSLASGVFVFILTFLGASAVVVLHEFKQRALGIESLPLRFSLGFLLKLTLIVSLVLTFFRIIFA